MLKYVKIHIERHKIIGLSNQSILNNLINQVQKITSSPSCKVMCKQEMR